MQNWETGELYACKTCGRLECNGCIKPRLKVSQPKRVVDPKGNKAFTDFYVGIVERKKVREEANTLPDDFTSAYRAEMKRLGTKGGTKTAERGSNYYKEIRKKRKAYAKGGLAQAEGGDGAGEVAEHV